MSQRNSLKKLIKSQTQQRKSLINTKKYNQQPPITHPTIKDSSLSIKLKNKSKMIFLISVIINTETKKYTINFKLLVKLKHPN
jgi:mRNA-degrading endonuclease RelE of RelBE toxin-antitoxin system